MTYHCHRCDKENEIVNQCGCDPNNLPTRPTQTFAEAFIEAARNGELTEEMALEWLDDEEVGKALDEIAACRSNSQAD